MDKLRRLKLFTAASQSASLPDIPTGLTVLYPDGDDSKALVDIITIHGLSGHPQLTWTNATTQHYWPLKSLPEDIPSSRIMAFGYNTSTSPFNRSPAIISDIARLLISNLNNKRRTDIQKKRPIIFVAHSLGGIVLKEFLHVSSNTGHESLADSVCGILFLGTPHKGSDLASFIDVISVVTKTLFQRPPDEILKDLASNSRHLLELDQLLRFKLGKIDIYSFYELLPVGPLKQPVVGRHSALLNIPSEIEQIGLEADHRQMCRPPDRNDFIYETIAQRIISIMNRQVDRAQYSNELFEMTNQFASRQMDYISFLTDGLHQQQRPLGVTASSFTQQTISLNVSESKDSNSSLDRLADVLKALPVHKVKDCVEAMQHIMKRATSLTELLLLAEKENERRRAEAEAEKEKLANRRIIDDLLAENERLRKQIRELRPPPWNPGDPSPAQYYPDLDRKDPGGEIGIGSQNKDPFDFIRIIPEKTAACNATKLSVNPESSREKCSPVSPIAGSKLAGGDYGLVNDHETLEHQPATSSSTAAVQFNPGFNHFSMGSRSTFTWPVLESGSGLLGHDLSSYGPTDPSLTPLGGSRSVTASPPCGTLTPEQRELKRQRDQARRDSKVSQRIRRAGSDFLTDDHTETIAEARLTDRDGSSIRSRSQSRSWSIPRHSKNVNRRHSASSVVDLPVDPEFLKGASRRSRSASMILSEALHDEDDNVSEERRPKLKSGVGIAAAALAVAGAAKYYRQSRFDREDILILRGRSRNRRADSTDNYSYSRSRSLYRRDRSMSHSERVDSTPPEAAGWIQHFRSKSRGRSRSRSRGRLQYDATQLGDRSILDDRHTVQRLTGSKRGSEESQDKFSRFGQNDAYYVGPNCQLFTKSETEGEKYLVPKGYLQEEALKANRLQAEKIVQKLNRLLRMGQQLVADTESSTSEAPPI